MVSGRHLPVILRTPRSRCWRPFSPSGRTARDGCACRCCCGNGPANRTPAGGRCPAGWCSPTRTSTPRPRGNWRRRSTWRGSRTWSRSGCSPTRSGCRDRGWWPPDSSGWCRSDADPRLPDDTAWHPVDDLPPTALDHGVIVERAYRRLQAKLSYTNIGFALAPAEFTIAELRRVYATALEHDVDPTNLQRILTRRGMLEPTGTTAASGPTGGRPAAMYRFTCTNCG